jgi:hypothetical protein
MLLLALWTAVQADARNAIGPLRVHPANPRYFTDGSGRAVYLTGSHTWDNLQDLGFTDPPPVFDYAGYLDFLSRHHHNFMRMWRWELPEWTERDGRVRYCTPHPWKRAGPGGALDGKPRFDLHQLDPAYFRRLRSRVKAARDRGIYVSIMLFEGWDLRFASWTHHPFHAPNNVQAIEGDANGDGKGTEFQTLENPTITSIQEAYVRTVVDTVNDLDNVLYEISNESGLETTAWQYHMIRYVKEYERRKPRQHPVGMTSIGYGVDEGDRLFHSPADWISPNPQAGDYRADPPASPGTKVILIDTDHLWGVGGDRAWVWKSFLRGLNPIWMDPYHSPTWDPLPANAEDVRRNLGYTWRYAQKMDLAAMTPRNEISSTGYCLANPGKEYLVYLPGGGEATVDLSAARGSLAVEWMNLADGTATAAGRVIGGARRAFRAPFAGDAVLYLRAEGHP